MRKKEKVKYRNCKLRLTFHAFTAAIKRNFPLSKLREMVLLKGRWCPHIEEEKRTCVFKNDKSYWTLIIAPYKCRIFIITIYPSNYSEIRMFKSFKRCKK